MIDNARLAALKWFAGAWSKYLLVSGKLSPVNWDRVVLICLALLLTSVFWLVRVSRPTYEQGARTESADARLTLEAKKAPQLNDVTKPEYRRPIENRAEADDSKITKVSTRSLRMRAERRASSIHYKRSYRNIGKDRQAAAHRNSGTMGSSLSVAVMNPDNGNPSEETTAPMLNNRGRTWAEASKIITRAINSAVDQSKSSLDPVKTDAKWADAKPETDTDNWGLWARTEDREGVGKNVSSSLIGIGPKGPCDDCKFEEFFLSAWSVGDPGVLVSSPRVLKDPFATTTAFYTGAEFGDPAAPAYPNCAKVRVPVPFAVDNSAYPRPLLAKTYADESLNVCRNCTNEGVRFRIYHAVPVARYVFQLHGHSWLLWSTSDQAYLDSQAISPGASYALKMSPDGNGKRNTVVGDSTFHCHFYPHFAAGMWAMWSTDDTLEEDSKFNPHAMYRHLVKFDVTSADGFANGYNLDGRVRTVFTHDHFGPQTSYYKAGLNASLIFEPNQDSGITQDILTPLTRAYLNDDFQIRTLVGAHEFAPQLKRRITTALALPAPVFTFILTLKKPPVHNDRDNQNPNTTALTSQTNTPVLHAQPCYDGAIANTDGDKSRTEEPKSRDQQSQAYVMDVPRDFPKALLANANERTLTILFWVFLFGTMINTLSTTSAIILAWMSNNRAKAELVLKQADALREARERELRIKELELRLAQLERQASAPSGLIVVAS